MAQKMVDIAKLKQFFYSRSRLWSISESVAKDVNAVMDLIECMKVF